MLPSIINATMIQSDIDSGVRIECDKCPVALAVQRAVKNFYLPPDHALVDVMVGTHAVYLVTAAPDGAVTEYKYNHNARSFIREFDNQRSVSPMHTITLTQE